MQITTVRKYNYLKGNNNGKKTPQKTMFIVNLCKLQQFENIMVLDCFFANYIITGVFFLVLFH
jgi:hypothetical protein